MAVEYAGCVRRFALLSSEGGKEGGGVRGRVGRRVREGREGRREEERKGETQNMLRFLGS